MSASVMSWWSWARFRPPAAPWASMSPLSKFGAPRILHPPSRGSGVALRGHLRSGGSALHQQSGEAQQLGAERAIADDPQRARAGRGRRPSLLRDQSDRPVSAQWGRCRQDLAWSEAGRHPGRAADQVRPRRQPLDRQGARPRSATNAARPRRRGDRMKRREFITLIGGAAAWPLAARAQSERLRRVGILMPYPESDTEGQMRVRAFKQELQRLGWIEGSKIQFDERWTTDNMDFVRANAASLLELKPDVIVSSGNRVIPILKQMTREVPIIFGGAVDPVGAGLVTSLAHPGGNITGFFRSSAKCWNC